MVVATEEVKLLKTLVSDLEKELKTKGDDCWYNGFMIVNLCINCSVNENSLLEAEVRSLQRKLMKRDGQILKQERELHKLRVSDQLTSTQQLEQMSLGAF